MILSLNKNQLNLFTLTSVKIMITEIVTGLLILFCIHLENNNKRLKFRNECLEQDKKDAKFLADVWEDKYNKVQKKLDKISKADPDSRQLLIFREKAQLSAEELGCPEVTVRIETDTDNNTEYSVFFRKDLRHVYYGEGSTMDEAIEQAVGDVDTAVYGFGEDDEL